MEISEHETQWLTDQGAQMMVSLGVKPGDSVIDFGCGKGRYTLPLSQVVGPQGMVVAVERDAGEVEVLRERIKTFRGQGTITVVNAEAIELSSIADDTVDHVFTFDVLQYIEDPEALFRTLCRVLKPNGSIHVYPAEVPHPGAVDVDQIALIIKKIGLQSAGSKQFKMMHNKDMVEDAVYTFKGVQR